ALPIFQVAQRQACDLVLLDIHMPGVDGMALAAQLRELTPSPTVVFVTAHAEHAVQVFELDATDYLTKPVRRERLQMALQKVQRQRQASQGARGVEPPGAGQYLNRQERGRSERVWRDHLRYLKAQRKCSTGQTADREYISGGALSDLDSG